MIWLFYTLFEIFMWNPHIRHFVVGANPMIQMGATVINDMIWLPIAFALPVYIVLLIRDVFQRLVLRDGVLFVFLVMWIISAVKIDIFFRIQFLILLIFFLLWGISILQSRTISVKQSFFALALLGMIVHYNSQLVPFPLNRGTSNISIMSFNFNTKAAFDDERTIQFIRRRVPDIVFLQELTPREEKFISAKLDDLYPYFLSPAPRHGKNDVMILSRKEILYADHIRLQTQYLKSYHSINHAVVNFDGQKIHLLNCHLHHAYKQLGAFLASPDSAHLYESLVASYNHQQEEARLLAEYIKSLQGPTIIAGDFNDTPNSKIYALFNKNYQNAFASAGWGLGTTFGEWALQKKLPRVLRGLSFDMLRIDHVFLSTEFTIKSAMVEKISAFDHHPQIITAILNKEK